MFNYYGVDIVSYTFVLIHLWLLGNKVRSAWIFGIMATVCFTFFGVLCGSPATVIMNIVFTIFHIVNYIKWGKTNENDGGV